MDRRATEHHGQGVPSHVTIFFSDIVGFSELTDKLGDRHASDLVNRMNELQERIITRDAAGKVMKYIGDSVFAIFYSPSVAMSRVLEIQRALKDWRREQKDPPVPLLRMGLHMGEILFAADDRLDIVSRHVNRASRVMSAADGDQILASKIVVDAGRDFITGVPEDQLAIRDYGEYYLKGVGPTELCEIADLRVRQPSAPAALHAHQTELSVISRLTQSGYVPVRRLGEGSFGVVYLADERSTQQPVAVKVLAPIWCEDTKAVEQFGREAERLQMLHVEGVVGIRSSQLNHRPPFLVMEYVDGKPLDHVLSGGTFDDIAGMFLKVVRSVSEAHRNGIVHGDLKPANILVSGGRPVILDFGMSTLTSERGSVGSSSSSFTGTPDYTAPERIQGTPPCVSSDIYSLGVILYKLITGKEPFRAGSIHELIQKHLYEEPDLPGMVNPSVPDGLQRICLKALEKNPGERYASAAEMADDIDRFLRKEVIRTRPTLYDNLLYHRTTRHITQIREWFRQGLLSSEETHSLVSSYGGLLRRGLPAIMEGRHMRFWQTLVYLSGWTVLNGALLWLWQYWDSLSRPSRLFLGTTPALSTWILTAIMYRLQRYRILFVALVVGVLCIPLLTGVWLYEFHAGDGVTNPDHEFFSSAGADGLTNRQLMMICSATLAAALTTMMVTRTTTHSGQTVMAAIAAYTAFLFLWGIKPDLIGGNWASVSLRYVLLPLGMIAVTGYLVRQPDRHSQYAPWLWLSAILSVIVSLSLAYYGPQEWMTGENLNVKSLMMVVMAGAVLVVAGLYARRLLEHRGRGATFTVIAAGLISTVVAVIHAGRIWPDGWYVCHLFGVGVPLPHAIFPFLSLAIVAAAYRTQMLLFLFIGLFSFARSIYLLGFEYFNHTQRWPALILGLGVIAFCVTLYFELRRTRGNAIDDMTQTRL